MLRSLFTTHSAFGARAAVRAVGSGRETAGRSESGAIGAKTAPGRPRWGTALLVGGAAGAVPYGLWWSGVWGYVLYLVIGRGLRQGAAGAEGVATVGNAIAAVSPALHLLLAVGAALWVARRAGAAPMGHGLLVGLASVASNLGLDLYFFPPLSEAVTYALVGVGGGLLGGLRARVVLARQEALYEAGRDVSRARSPQEVARAVGDRLEERLGVAGVTLWGRAPTEGASSCGASGEDQAHNLSEGECVLLGAWAREGGHPPPPGERLRTDRVPGLADLLRRRREFLVVRTKELPAVARAAWEAQKARSVLFLPLDGPSGALLGVLAVASSGRFVFPRGTVRAHQTAASQAALALVNLRLVEEARRAAVLRERQRMAHEIHDTIAQGFTSIIMTVEAAEAKLSAAWEPEARRYLEGVRRTARENLAESRRLVWALRPEALEGSSLPEALGRLAASWSEESGVSCAVAVTGTPRTLPAATEAILLRAAQEALSNVRKHAAAKRAALTLSFVGDTVLLDAQDDGVGFAPDASADGAPRPEGGFGLRAMRERVEKVGGILTVESAVGEGTSLTASLPVAEPVTETWPVADGARKEE